MTVIFWLVVATYLWYGYSEYITEQRERALQNLNNEEMESL